MSTPATKRPRALAELCHDALAEGVIAKHGGLPPSWLERFREDDAVMAQLRTLVLESTTREDALREDSLVTIIVQYPSHSVALGWWQMFAGHLGGWQFKLLETYFQGLKWYTNDVIDPEDDLAPMHDPLGGYRIDWDEDDWMPMWEHLVRWHLRDDVFSPMYTELTHTLLDAFEIDVETEYADEMNRWEAEREDPDFFDDWGAEAIADFFPDHTEKVLRQALFMEVSDLHRKRSWMWDLEDRRPDPNDPPCNHAFRRASFCTLFFNMRQHN
jgi:hypothetical protein